MNIGVIHGPVDENDSGKQRNHELRHKHSPGGFITYMSNGDDSGTIVSMGCKVFSDAIAARHSDEICSRNLKRSLRVLHYPLSPEKGAETGVLPQSRRDSSSGTGSAAPQGTSELEIR